ncbi:MAG: hypothetical protein HC888_14220 [Candidatus Competibacteraceae bacterium]|nr:hypothetical protein [Candidatus Competibacteraceae bacterium]
MGEPRITEEKAQEVLEHQAKRVTDDDVRKVLEKEEDIRRKFQSVGRWTVY